RERSGGSLLSVGHFLGADQPPKRHRYVRIRTYSLYEWCPDRPRKAPVCSDPNIEPLWVVRGPTPKSTGMFGSEHRASFFGVGGQRKRACTGVQNAAHP